MATSKRRGFAGQADAILDGPAPAAADVAAAASSSPAAPDPSASPLPAAPDVGQVHDDDGPRLRASEASRLANKDVLTVRRTVYIGADDWRRVLRLAMRQGLTASDVVRSALRSYLAQHGGDGSTS